MYPSERNTEAFKRGYRDCRDRRPALHTRENDNMTFYAHDYIEGWEDCRNTQYWDAVRENKSRDTAERKAFSTFFGITIVNLDDPAVLHSAIKNAVGE